MFHRRELEAGGKKHLTAEPPAVTVQAWDVKVGGRFRSQLLPVRNALSICHLLAESLLGTLMSLGLTAVLAGWGEEYGRTRSESPMKRQLWQYPPTQAPPPRTLAGSAPGFTGLIRVLMGTSVPSLPRVGDTQPLDAVAPCLVTGDRSWRPMQVTATSGKERRAGGTRAAATAVTGGAVSPGTSTAAEQGCPGAVGGVGALLDPQFLFLRSGAFVSPWHGVREKPTGRPCEEARAVSGMWLHPDLWNPPPSNPRPL